MCLKISWYPQYSHGLSSFSLSKLPFEHNPHIFKHTQCRITTFDRWSTHTPHVPPWGEASAALFSTWNSASLDRECSTTQATKRMGSSMGIPLVNHLGLHQWGAVGEGQLPGTWGWKELGGVGLRGLGGWLRSWGISSTWGWC